MTWLDWICIEYEPKQADSYSFFFTIQWYGFNILCFPSLRYANLLGRVSMMAWPDIQSQLGAYWACIDFVLVNARWDVYIRTNMYIHMYISVVREGAIPRKQWQGHYIMILIAGSQVSINLADGPKAALDSHRNHRWLPVLVGEKTVSGHSGVSSGYADICAVHQLRGRSPCSLCGC